MSLILVWGRSANVCFKSYFGQDPYGYVYVQPGYYPPYSAQYSFPPSNSSNSYRERRKPKPPKDNAQMWCDVCGVGCIGQQSYAGTHSTFSFSLSFSHL